MDVLSRTRHLDLSLDGYLDGIEWSASFTFNVEECLAQDQSQPDSVVLDVRVCRQRAAGEQYAPAPPPTEVSMHIVLSACDLTSSTVFRSLAYSLDGSG